MKHLQSTLPHRKMLQKPLSLTYCGLDHRFNAGTFHVSRNVQIFENLCSNIYTQWFLNLNNHSV